MTTAPMEDRQWVSQSDGISRPPRRGRTLSVFGVVVSAVLTAVLIIRVDLSAAWAHIVEIELDLLLLPALVTLVNLSTRAIRWWLIFPARFRLGFGRTFFAFATGGLANYLLPARGGDLLRCYLATRGKLAERMGLGLSTLAVEKIFDALCLLVIVTVSGMLFAPPDWYAKMQTLVALVVTLVIAVVAMICWNAARFGRWAERAIRALRFSRLAERIAGFVTMFARGLQGTVSLGRLSLIGGCTGLIWICEGAAIWGLSRALCFELRIPGGMLVATILGLSRAIPAGPGQVGSYEFFMVTATGLLGMASDQGLALGLVTHAWVMLFAVAFGFSGAIATSTSMTTMFGRGVTPDREHSTAD